VLYKLFEWASRPRSTLLLLGIANSIDLTERFLPRLRQRLRCSSAANGASSGAEHVVTPEPELLIFSPYNHESLKAIVQARLVRAGWRVGPARAGEDEEWCSEGEPGHEFSTAALELCCRKVHATSGDARRVLELCRQVRTRFCCFGPTHCR
jgi:cell division control protein 6